MGEPAPKKGAPIRIAMWSGPRNLSTALMRSFGARADCAVADEPFYAAYLASGVEHPMKREILAAHETDPEAVARTLLGPAPGGRAIWYQKHMPHHMLPGFPRGWFAACRHAVLIRAPERVAASFDAGRPRPTLEDLGVPQLDDVIAGIERATGRTPPVIEAEDIRADPEGMLRALVAALDIPFDAAMLAWPPGPRPTDGVWAAHWYGAVLASSGFAPPPREEPVLAPHLREIAARARPSFERLQARKLTPL
ncbi:HAD family hydrolase [Pikeienuella sp. HZG-20]|uniref:sulfotransferase-like domain-containing protein n=1 Tax=Paludibacillus litoralis TaxID=3133267 RepID=UPI0030EE4757